MTGRIWLLIGMVFVLLIGGLWWIGTTRSAGSLNGNAKAPVSTLASPVESVVSAKGSIAPTQFARLAFSASGTVMQVQMKEGDKVKAGDIIAQLDTGDLRLHVQIAQDALDIAAAMLAQAKTPATTEEIAAAEAQLRNAQANYDKARNGASGPELQIALATLTKAQAAVAQAQTAYDRVGGASNPQSGMLPQALALHQATQDLQIAKANYELKVKADAAALAAAEAAQHTAQAILDQKKTGARPADLAVLEAHVKQAKTALTQAQAALAKASLTAPFDGQITQLNLRAGETVAAGAVVATLADVSRWRVETSDLDEWGAARVKLGQPAKVIVNAFANKTLTGKVTNIAAQSVTLATGDIAYVVTLLLDQNDPDVRWGMSVKVEFQKP